MSSVAEKKEVKRDLSREPRVKNKNAPRKITHTITIAPTDYPNKRMLAIQFLGGDNFNDWVWDMLEKFNGFAKDSGCDGIEATARQGFWKWLKQDDFEQSYVVYEKRIEK
mgnify:CR=1 FL=1